MAQVAVDVEGTPAQAAHTIRYYAKWAAGVGVIPIPLIDLAAVTGVQVKMVKRLAKQYGVDYDEDSGKALIGALLGAVLPAKFGYGGIGSLIKAVPGIGPILGIATVPAFNYGSTLAVGRVFQKHFATGGTMLDFDADKNKASFRAEYQSAASSAPDDVKTSSRRPATA
jgi:uncharacterized protein (DUF697 family)